MASRYSKVRKRQVSDDLAFFMRVKLPLGVYIKPQ